MNRHLHLFNTITSTEFPSGETIGWVGCPEVTKKVLEAIQIMYMNQKTIKWNTNRSRWKHFTHINCFNTSISYWNYHRGNNWIDRLPGCTIESAGGNKNRHTFHRNSMGAPSTDFDYDIHMKNRGNGTRRIQKC